VRKLIQFKELEIVLKGFFQIKQSRGRLQKIKNLDNRESRYGHGKLSKPLHKCAVGLLFAFYEKI